MFLKKHGRKAVFLGMALIFAISVFVPARAAEEKNEKPYRIVDGKIDFGTYNGYRRYHNSCHACHGLAGTGTSFAPALVESLRVIDESVFWDVVVNGRINGVIGAAENIKDMDISANAANPKVMPPFHNDPNVMDYLDNIYSYVKARSDGVIGPGRPAHLPKEKGK
jgi:mono/diheme cytochrome c family protein